MTKKERICVALSGGVDSAVSAALLLKEGHDVFGVFVQVWQPDFLDCTQEEDRKSAKRVAAALGIPFFVVDASAEYKRDVVDVFTSSYARGETPNPDVLCNRHIKFGVLWDFAQKHGATRIATGHYAQVVDYNGVPCFAHAPHADKDQVYFLAQVPATLVPAVLFPVGAFPKKKTRELAAEFGLPVAQKKDSQGLCFMGMVDMGDFLKELIPMHDGTVVNESSEVIGTHSGASQFTLGQRHGFILTHPPAHPLYVIHVSVTNNTITVSEKFPQGTETLLLHSVVRFASLSEKTQYFAQVRYHGTLVPCIVDVSESSLTVHLVSPQLVAPGQLCAIYDGEVLVASGVVSGAVDGARNLS